MSDIDLTEAIEAARKNLARHEGNEYMHRGCGKGCMHYLSAEAALHVAAPLIESAVREQVAREIETQRQPITVHIDYPDVAWDAARKSSARIARGDS